MMHGDNFAHRVDVGKADVVEKAAPQKGVWQFLFVVGCDDHDGPHGGAHGLACFVDVKFHPVELLQQIVRKFDIGLVDLVDQQHRPLFGRKGLPQFAAFDIVGDVIDAFVAKLAIAQPADGVVFIQALLRAGRGFDVPFDHRHIQCCADLSRQLCLAGARLSFDQQRALQGDRRIHGHGQIIGRDIGVGASKGLGHSHLLSLAQGVVLPCGGQVLFQVYQGLILDRIGMYHCRLGG